MSDSLSRMLGVDPGMDTMKKCQVQRAFELRSVPGDFMDMSSGDSIEMSGYGFCQDISWSSP